MVCSIYIVMTLEQQLEDYILSHPDFWEFDDEVKEVERLRLLISIEKCIYSFPINLCTSR